MPWELCITLQRKKEATSQSVLSVSQRSEINLSNVPLQLQKHKFCSVQGCQNITVRRRVCKKHGAFDDLLFARYVLNRDAQIGGGATQGQNQLLPNQYAQPQVYTAPQAFHGQQVGYHGGQSQFLLNQFTQPHIAN